MKRNIVLSLIAGTAFLPAIASAQMAPMAAVVPKPTAAEEPFIAKLQLDIPKRFATLADATKAGYFRYTNEDSTGAISWVNPKIDATIDLEAPNQLWYDVNGRLLGVDYTVHADKFPKPPPALFGYAIGAARWTERGAHVHYGVLMPDGTMKYGATSTQKLTDAGGTLSTEQYDLPANKAALVKLGLATSPDQVKFAFLHPTMWDLVVWVLPNPDGAFADANPNVKPATPKKPSM